MIQVIGPRGIRRVRQMSTSYGTTRRPPLKVILTTLGTAAVAAPLFAVDVPTTPANEQPAVGVIVHLGVAPAIASRRITAQLKDEAAVLWRPYGVRLDWADAEASQGVSDSVSIEAMLDRQFEASRRPEWPRVLGRVVTNPATPTRRTIYVSFGATRSALARRTATGRTFISVNVLDQELARALGRVLAHEIGHVLIGVPGHDGVGLMRPVFSAEELAKPDSRPFRLTCSSANRLRRRLGALTRYPQLGSEEASAPLEVEGAGDPRPDLRGEASCIAP